MNRRKFIHTGSLLTGSLLLPQFPHAADAWSADSVRHLIPLANHDSILIKASFSESQQGSYLKIGSTNFPGRQQDTLGRFWSFYATGLESNQQYELGLHRANGDRLSDAWPLRTAPATTANSEHVRLLIFTCAGGPDNAQLADGVWRFLPVSTRQRLLRRALSFAPDLAIGIGDQVYWDQTVVRGDGPAQRTSREALYGKYGSFNEDLPVLGSSNEAALTRCMDEQLASLYGTDFRSVPLILTQDDHDYFENDEGTDSVITFPPRNFTAQLGRAQQSLYFPEYLPEPGRPVFLAGSYRDGVSESYGSLRWGSLLELLLYDCRRFITLSGPTAVFVEQQAERWLEQRTADEGSTRHLIQIPSTPFGWSAGKWGEWYPDYLQANGQLGIEDPKPYWQSGWFNQHQRILASLSSQQHRIPVLVSGDLHAIGSGMITRSGNLRFDRPVHSILAGPISTGTGWPSAVRGIGASVPVNLQVQERVSPVENNGFTILDIDPDTIAVNQYAWLPDQGLDAIDLLQPFSSFSISRQL